MPLQVPASLPLDFFHPFACAVDQSVQIFGKPIGRLLRGVVIVLHVLLTGLDAEPVRGAFVDLELVRRRTCGGGIPKRGAKLGLGLLGHFGLELDILLGDRDRVGHLEDLDAVEHDGRLLLHDVRRVPVELGVDEGFRAAFDGRLRAQLRRRPRAPAESTHAELPARGQVGAHVARVLEDGGILVLRVPEEHERDRVGQEREDGPDFWQRVGHAEGTAQQVFDALEHRGRHASVAHDVRKQDATSRGTGVLVGQDLVVDQLLREGVREVDDGRLGAVWVAAARDVGFDSIQRFNLAGGFGVRVHGAAETVLTGHCLMDIDSFFQKWFDS